MIPLTRRKAVKIIGGSIAGSAIVGHVHARPGNDNAPFEAQIRSVISATKKYHDIQEALDDGYQVMGPYVPDMGWHLVNFNRIEQAARRGINIRQPQGLVYNLGRELGSVEYIVPKDDDKPDVFNDEDEELDTSEDHGWHEHPEAQHIFADDLEDPADSSDNSPDSHPLSERLNSTNWTEFGGGLPTEPDPDLEPNDDLSTDWGLDRVDPDETRTVDYIIEHDDWWTLHAWVHFDNPNGVFASFNHNSEWDPLDPPPNHHG